MGIKNVKMSTIDLMTHPNPYLEHFSTKTNKGLEWYQSKAYDFLYCCRIFFSNFKGLVSLNLKKHCSAFLDNVSPSRKKTLLYLFYKRL
jgi:hypothetical protein